MADNDTAPAGEFGTCCSELKEAMSGEDFDPLIYVGPDDVLYFAIGLVDIENEDEPGTMDHPVFFCPFCGKGLQTAESVADKAGADEDEDEEAQA